MNFTLLLNVGAVFTAGASVSLVGNHALISLALAFAAGVTATIASRYAFGLALEDDTSA
jgi:hypothetical protein